MAESEHLVALSPAKNTKDLRSLLLEIARNQSTVSNRPRFLKSIRDLKIPFILSLFVPFTVLFLFSPFPFPFSPICSPPFPFLYILFASLLRSRPLHALSLAVLANSFGRRYAWQCVASSWPASSFLSIAIASPSSAFPTNHPTNSLQLFKHPFTR